MADAQQQDVKEEAERTVGRVKGRGLIRRESWSHLKGRFGRTSPMEIRNPWGRDTWQTYQKRTPKEWFALEIFIQITTKITEYLNFTLMVEKKNI